MVLDNERMVDNLHSINKNDERSVFEIVEALQRQYVLNKKLIPFADDPFGNAIWFDYSQGDVDPSIVYYDTDRVYDQDDYEGEFVCSCFDEFLEMLFEGE